MMISIPLQTVPLAPIVVGALGMVSKELEKKTVGIKKQRKTRDHPDHSIFKSATTLKGLREMLVWKAHK